MRIISMRVAVLPFGRLVGHGAPHRAPPGMNPTDLLVSRNHPYESSHPCEWQPICLFGFGRSTQVSRLRHLNSMRSVLEYNKL